MIYYELFRINWVGLRCLSLCQLQWVLRYVLQIIFRKLLSISCFSLAFSLSLFKIMLRLLFFVASLLIFVLATAFFGLFAFSSGLGSFLSIGVYDFSKSVRPCSELLVGDNIWITLNHCWIWLSLMNPFLPLCHSCSQYSHDEWFLGQLSLSVFCNLSFFHYGLNQI